MGSCRDPQVKQHLEAHITWLQSDLERINVEMAKMLKDILEEHLQRVRGDALGGITVTGPFDVLRGTDPANQASPGDLNFPGYPIASRCGRAPAGCGSASG